MNTEENKWLTVIEAAKKLNISEVDIYTAALDGNLRLSYNFVNGATVRSATVVSIDEAEVTCRPFEYICGPFWGEAYWRDGDWLKVEDFLLPVTGVLDIPMLGGALLDVKRNRQRLGGGSELTLLCPAGILLENSDGELFQLQEFSTITGTYRIAPCLPDSRDFIVRCDALNDWAMPGAKAQAAPAIKAETQELVSPAAAPDGAVVASATSAAAALDGHLDAPILPQPEAPVSTPKADPASELAALTPWSDERKLELLAAHNKLKAERSRNPTETLAKENGVSGTVIRHRLNEARSLHKPATTTAAPFDQLFEK